VPDEVNCGARRARGLCQAARVGDRDRALVGRANQHYRPPAVAGAGLRSLVGPGSARRRGIRAGDAEGMIDFIDGRMGD
jgi:hypothetical protein